MAASDGLRQRRQVVDDSTNSDSDVKKAPKPMKKQEKVMLSIMLPLLLIGPILAACNLWYNHGIAFHETFGHKPPVDDPHAPEVGNFDSLRDFLSTKQILMIGGPHRGGTTALWNSLSLHPNISEFGFKHGLDRRRAPKMDVTFYEGIFLQNIYPKFGLDHKWHAYKIAKHWILSRLGLSPGLQEGIGRYALDTEAHLKEDSKLISDNGRARLFGSWSFLWDLSQPVLMEKSPSNMIISRFLHALWGVGFSPDRSPARFIFITRHPIAVALATKRAGPHTVRDLSIYDLVKHWVVAEETMTRDLAMLPKTHWVTIKLESFTEHPAETLEILFKFLGLEPDKDVIHKAVEQVELHPNSRYFDSWCRQVKSHKPDAAEDHRRITEELGARIKALHYDVDDAIKTCRWVGQQKDDSVGGN